MIVKAWRYTLFFLLCLTIALLLNLPVQQVLPHVQLPPTVQLAGVDGSILKGRAQEIRIDGFPVRSLRYRYMPSCIPLLKLCYQLDYEQGDLQLGYDLLNGDTEVSGSEIEYPVSDLLGLMPSPALVKPTGRLQLNVEDLSMQQNKLVSVNGQLIWRDLGINENGIKLDIGDYQVDFNGDDERYEFTLSDLDAALQVEGEGSVYSSGAYELDVRIDARQGIDPQVRSVLELVARRTSGNQYRVQQKGQLPRQMQRQLFR